MRFIKPHRKIKKVFIHCSASDNPKHDNAATIDAWHKVRGWAGIGYHFFIRKNGLIERGRDINKTPAAQGGHNRGTIAICLSGLEKSKFTSKQYASLINLCQQINLAYDSKVTFHGHCEVSAKTCPVIDYKKVLDLSPGGNLGSTILTKQDNDVVKVTTFIEEPETTGAILRHGNKGWRVRALQQQLESLGYHVGNIDGDFGKRTRAAVLAFQADNHLITDGVVGPATNEAFNDAENREVAPERKAATILTLVDNGSRIASASLTGGSTGAAVSAAGIMGVAGQFSEKFQMLKSQLEPIAEPFGGLSTIMVVGLLVVVGFMTWQLYRAGRARADDHRTGKTL